MLLEAMVDSVEVRLERGTDIFIYLEFFDLFYDLDFLMALRILKFPDWDTGLYR